MEPNLPERRTPNGSGELKKIKETMFIVNNQQLLLDMK
jgi:hypothetical protein